MLSSLYIHFPFCKSFCNYCDFHSETLGLDFTSYHQYMQQAWIKHQNFLQEQNIKWDKLDTIYIGGGTPSLWSESGALFLLQLLSPLSIKANCEFTIEMNPAAWTPESFAAWQKLGANRFSLGVQTLNQELLSRLDRAHSAQEALSAIQFLSEAMVNFSVDLMLGLPYSQGQRDIIAELEQVLKFSPSHLSIYILTPPDNYIHLEHLPSEDWIRSEFLQVSNFLRSRGFLHYEVSNFALPGKESRHNLCYWKSESVAALGPSATGLLRRDTRAIRYKWHTDRPDFQIEQLTPEGLRLERFYMSIRTNMGIDPKDYFKDADWEVLKQKLVPSWQAQGLIENFDEHRLALSPQGYLVLDSIMDDVFVHTRAL